MKKGSEPRGLSPELREELVWFWLDSEAALSAEHASTEPLYGFRACESCKGAGVVESTGEWCKRCRGTGYRSVSNNRAAKGQMHVRKTQNKHEKITPRGFAAAVRAGRIAEALAALRPHHAERPECACAECTEGRAHEDVLRKVYAPESTTDIQPVYRAEMTNVRAEDFYAAFGLPAGWKRDARGRPILPPGSDPWVSVVQGYRLVGHRRSPRYLHMDYRLAARWKGKKAAYLDDSDNDSGRGVIVINTDGTARPRVEVRTPAADARFLLPNGTLVCGDGSREPEPGLFLTPPKQRGALLMRLDSAARAFEAVAPTITRPTKKKLTTAEATRAAGVTRAQVKRWIDSGKVETEGRGKARRIVIELPSD